LANKAKRTAAAIGVVLCVGGAAAVTVALAERGTNDDPAGPAAVAPAATAVPPWQTSPPLPPERAIDAPIVPARALENGRIAAEVGCLADLSAESLDTFFTQRVGPSLGTDNPHVTALGGDRYLWLFNDTFLDYTGSATTMRSDASSGTEGVYVPNVALVQEGLCFTMLHTGTLAVPRPFQVLPQSTEGRFLWPLGAGLGESDRLYVFWSEMQQDPPPGKDNGISRHPIRTWLGVYDAATFTEIAFEPAPNAGIAPQYGSAVETDGDYSYLFGNSNVLNLTVEGTSFYSGPFSGTKEYLARVPAGRFTSTPEYYTGGDGWSSDPAAAVPISERFYIFNGMQPRLVDGRWMSVVKRDEYWGNDIVIDVAENPWGPWETVYQEEYVARPPEAVDADTIATYHAILLPWRDPNGQYVVMISQNAGLWANAVADPRQYRPRAFSVPLELG
jgi:hypothetical protein